MKPVLHPEKVSLAYFASIERQVTQRFKTANLKDIQSQEDQFSLLRSVLADYLSISNNKENNCQNSCMSQKCLEADSMREKLREKDEQIDKLKKQLNIEFQMTRSFVNNFKKQSEQTQKQDSNTNYPNIKRLESLNLQKIALDCSILLPSRQSLTDRRCYQPIAKPSEVANENKALMKLNKLQKFLCKPRSRAENSTISNISWNFSPTKADYKQQNENLKILQDNLRIQLDNKACIDESKKKEYLLKQREKKCQDQEEALFKKEMELNKRHMDILRKEKKLKVHI